MQIDSVGVSFGLRPRFVSVFFCFLFRFFRWRNASLAGGFAGRRFGVVVVSLFCFNRFADFKDRASLYRCIYCLLTRKDRAISATSAKLEEKKKVPWLQSVAMPSRMPGTQVKNIHLTKPLCGLILANPQHGPPSICHVDEVDEM